MATFTTTQAGSWGTGSTWVGGVAPTLSTEDIVIVHSGVVVDAAKTCATLTFTGTAVKTCVFTLNANLTVTGALTFNGNSATNRTQVLSNTVGTARTITAAAVSLTNVDFQDITGAGAAAPFTGTSIGDCGGNTSITPTTPTTRYGVVAGNWSSTATWSTSSGGSGGASVPLPQDNVVLDGSSAAGTYVPDMPRIGKDLTCTGFTRTLQMPSVSGVYSAMYGSLTLSSGMATSLGTGGIAFAGRGSHMITMAGKTTAANSIQQTGYGGTYTQQDAFSTGGGAIAIVAGTWDSNGYALAMSTMSVNTGGSMTMGATALTATSTSAPWTCVSGATLSAASSTINITDTSSATKTFAGGGKTYGTVAIATPATTGTLVVTGSNTFANLNLSPGITLTLPASTTTTLTSGASLSGTVAKPTTIQSSSAATKATLSKTTGIITVDNAAIIDSAATGGALFEYRSGATIATSTGWTVATVNGNAGLRLSAATIGLTIS